MRWDRVALRGGYILSACLAAGAYLLGFGWSAALGILLATGIMTRSSVYIFFERYLAFKTFGDFRSGRIRHQCAACGFSCHLRVNLAKDDVDRLLKHAKDKGIQETVIETRGGRFWLKRRANHECVFLTYTGNTPRCSVYSIRPTACRLYPLIPTGNRLKVDPFCPGLSKTHGHTFKEHLVTQEVGAHVRKALGNL
jgi:Fe-S-cluster containining protein